MKISISIIFCQLLLLFLGNAQSSLFLVEDIPSDSLYPQTALKKENIKSITCIEHYFELENMLSPDTLAIYKYKLDSLFRIDYSIQFLSNWQIEPDTSSYYCQYDYKGSMLIKNCRRMSQAYSEVYRSGKLVSLKSYRLSTLTNQFSLLRSDSMAYDGNRRSLWMTMLYSPLLIGEVDTVKRIFMYDSLGRLVGYSINPPTAFRSVHKAHSGYNYDKVIYEYKYNGNQTIAKHFVINNNFRDTLLDVEEVVSTHFIDENFNYRIFRSLPLDENWYDIDMKLANKQYSLEGTISNLRCRVNRINSILPSYITINEGDAIRIYSFKYEVRE